MSENINVLVSGLNLESVLTFDEYPRVRLDAEIVFTKLVRPQSMDFDAIRDGIAEIFRRAVTFAPRETPSAGRRDETTTKTTTDKTGE